jgi:tetratricopeptide (TPR) repeat protein
VAGASALLDEAENAGIARAALWLMQAECRAELDLNEDARKSLGKVLRSTDATEFQINQAVALLTKVAPDQISEVPSLAAVRALDRDNRLWIARKLAELREGVDPAIVLFREILSESSSTQPQRQAAQDGLILALIARGDFHEAQRCISSTRPERGTHPINSVFNYAMAEWAQSGQLPVDLFDEVLRQSAASDDRDKANANYFQCLALAAWAAQRHDQARQYLFMARQEIMSRPLPAFSCWRYRTIPLRDFLEDLDELERLLSGEQLRPAVFEHSQLVAT